MKRSTLTTMLFVGLVANVVGIGPAFAQGPDCDNAQPISGTWQTYDFSPTGVSSMPGSSCGNLSSNAYYQWTALEDGDYRVQGYLAGPYAEMGVFAGDGCSATNVDCVFLGPNDYYAGIALWNVQAGQTFLIRGVNSWGTLSISRQQDPCLPDTVPDIFEPNNSCATGQAIGNGTYHNLSLSSTNGQDFYKLIIEPNEVLWINHYGFAQNFSTVLWPDGPGSCVPGNELASGSFNPSLLYYQNPTAQPLPVILEVNGAGCGMYSLQISGVEDPNTTPTFTPFCDPMTNNSVGASTTLTGVANPGSPVGVRLESTMGPPGQFGSLLVGTAAMDPGVALGNGFFCLSFMNGDLFARYNIDGTAQNSIGRFTAQGRFENLVGTSASGFGFDVPGIVPTINLPINAGSTWHFQLWHREPNGGSQFSNGVTVGF